MPLVPPNPDQKQKRVQCPGVVCDLASFVTSLCHCPAHAWLLTRNDLVNEVKFLELIPNSGKDQ